MRCSCAFGATHRCNRFLNRLPRHATGISHFKFESHFAEKCSYSKRDMRFFCKEQAHTHTRTGCVHGPVDSPTG